MVFVENLGQIPDPTVFRYLNIDEKTELLTGNFLLAAETLHQWNEDRLEFLPMDYEYLRECVDEELREFEEVRGRIDQLSHVELGTPWSEMDQISERWDVASEAVDVAVFAGNMMSASGFTVEDVARFWAMASSEAEGEDEIFALERLVGQMKEVCEGLGMDFAHALFEKIIVNDQHYPKFFSDAGLMFTMMGKMRRDIRDLNTQMPPLVLSHWGETPLAFALGNIYGQNGYNLHPIGINGDGEWGVVVIDDSTNTYGNLYKP